MSETLAAKERLRASVELMTSVDSVGALVSVADLAFILASHDAMEKALAKANKPRWFYADDEGTPFDSVQETVEAFLDEFGPDEGFPNGRGFLRIDTMRPCATVWAVVRILTEAEREARDDGLLFDVTECATEAEALALLEEAAR